VKILRNNAPWKQHLQTLQLIKRTHEKVVPKNMTDEEREEQIQLAREEENPADWELKSFGGKLLSVHKKFLFTSPARKVIIPLKSHKFDRKMI